MSIYLDHAASAPLRDSARDAWAKALKVKRNARTVSRYAQAFLGDQMQAEQIEAIDNLFRQEMTGESPPYLYDILIHAVQNVNWGDIADAVLALHKKREYIALVPGRNDSE